MRGSGLLNPTEFAALTPDTLFSVGLTTTPVAANWPAGTALVCISAGPLGCYFNPNSTAVTSPGSSLLTSGSSQISEYIPGDMPIWKQISGGSTGFSVLGTTAGGGAFTMSLYNKA